MKKILLLMSVLFVSAVSVLADNSIKMVTYFPVPYVAYNDLSVQRNCDVGILGSCSMQSATGLTVLPKANEENAGRLIVNKGKLELNSLYDLSSIQNTNLSIGDSDETSIPELTFASNLTIYSPNVTYQSIEASTGKLDDLKLYGMDFPECTEGNVSWKQLRLASTDEEGVFSGIYLVCGEGYEVVSECESNPSTATCCTAAEIAAGKEYQEKKLAVIIGGKNWTCACPTGKTYNEETGKCEFVKKYCMVSSGTLTETGYVSGINAGKLDISISAHWQGPTSMDPHYGFSDLDVYGFVRGTYTETSGRFWAENAQELCNEDTVGNLYTYYHGYTCSYTTGTAGVSGNAQKYLKIKRLIGRCTQVNESYTCATEESHWENALGDWAGEYCYGTNGNDDNGSSDFNDDFIGGDQLPTPVPKF